MLISYNWLKEYIDGDIPSPEELAERLTLYAYEVEFVEENDGDYILDIDVLPNRASDSLSHWGVAREVAAIFELPLSIPEAQAQGALNKNSSEHISLSIENDSLVPRATKRLVENVSVGPSPDWLKKRLSLFGQRSINNIVDITNLVMFETGQPVHAFDFDKVAGEGKKAVVIRGAKKGEKITVLDGKEYELQEGMLVIADSEKALDIAGVKGGANSLIDAKTTRVMLSVCSFDPTSVRTTSQKLNLRTDASKRFENGISQEMPRIAMERLTELVEDITGGKASPDIVEHYPRVRNPYKVGFSLERLHSLLGADISEKEAENILERLGFDAEKVNPRERIVELAKKHEGVPYKYGASISYDAPNYFDCSAFTSYLYAQAGISIPRITVDQYVFGKEIQKDELKPGDIVFGCNSHEHDEEEFYSYIEKKNVIQKTRHQETKEYAKGTRVEKGVSHNGIYLGDGKVIHASGKSHLGKVVIEDLETSKSFRDVTGCRRIEGVDKERYAVTVPHWRLDVRGEVDIIEEIGRIYGYEKVAEELPETEGEVVHDSHALLSEKIRDILTSRGFSEIYLYTFRNEGDVEVKNKIASDKGYLRMNLSDGVKEALEFNIGNAPLFGADVIKLFEIGHTFAHESEELHLCIGAQAVGNKQDAAQVAVAEAMDALKDIGIEIKENNETIIETVLPSDLEITYEIDPIDDRGIQYEHISVYPYVLRDIAVWVPSDVSSVQVEELIREKGSCQGKEVRDEWLRRVDLFDEFEKEGRTSYAFHLVFQSNEKTLSDAEVNDVMKRVEDAVKEKGWEVR